MSKANSRFKDRIVLFAVSHTFKRVYILRNVPRKIARRMTDNAGNSGKILLCLYNQWLDVEERRDVQCVRFANLLSKDFYRAMYRYVDHGIELESTDEGLDNYQVVGDSRGVLQYKRATGCFLDYINGWKNGHVERI